MTADNKKKDPKLWQKVDQGEYNVVYVTPEEILDPMGHFMTTTVIRERHSDILHL